MKYHRSGFEIATDVVLYVLLGVVAFSTLYPFIYLLALSLNDPIDAAAGEIYFYPRKFSTQNWAWVFLNDNLVRGAFNSVARTVITTTLHVLVTGMIAYVLSRRGFVFRKLFNTVLVITMYVSAGLIPTYLLMKSLGLMNTFLVYIVPGLVGVFQVFLMRTYIEQLPDGLVESGYMDGAHDFRIYTSIILPICIPMIATIGLFTAVSQWNSWFDTYLYNSRNPSLTVLQYELQKIIQTADSFGARESEMTNASAGEIGRKISSQGIKATLTMLVTVPIVLIYPFLQKYFVKGMTLGAMKD